MVLIAGARAGMYLSGRSEAIVPNDATVIQIDVDGAEIGRLRPVDQAIVADCREAFEAFADGCAGIEWPTGMGGWRRCRAGDTRSKPSSATRRRRPGPACCSERPLAETEFAFDALAKNPEEIKVLILPQR